MIRLFWGIQESVEIYGKSIEMGWIWGGSRVDLGVGLASVRTSWGDVVPPNAVPPNVVPPRTLFPRTLLPNVVAHLLGLSLIHI